MKMNELSTLVENLRIDADWADCHSWDAPICLYDDLWDATYVITASSATPIDVDDLLENLRLDAEWAKSNKIEELEDLEAPAPLYDDLLDTIEVIERIKDGEKVEK